MRGRGKRQIFISILVGFLVCGLTCYGLLPTIIKPIQGASFSFTFSEKISLNDGESYPMSLPLWQINESGDIFAQIVTGTSLNRVSTKNAGNVRIALRCSCHNTDSSHTQISLHIIDSTNTVFKFINGQIYQRLDIPPPHASASL